jgi:hypothetical protein
MAYFILTKVELIVIILIPTIKRDDEEQSANAIV